MSQTIRVAGALVGSIYQQPDMAAKYGRLFKCIEQRFNLTEVYDARLGGIQRYWNACQTFTPSISRWRERYFKNPAAFEMRSSRAQKHFRTMQGRVDVILQLGALFDSVAQDGAPPVVLYTDHTSAMTAQQLDTNRNPFSPAELMRWQVDEKKFYQRAVHICTRSNAVKRSLMDVYFVPVERISVIGGGVNFGLRPADETTVRRLDSAFTLLFIGLDFHRKGGDLVLQAFSIVRKLYPGAKLIMVTRDGIPAGLPLDGVRVLAPIWDRQKLEALYRRADVFVLPARHETWGDVFLEAMSFELPCIGVTGQAMEEIIIHGKTGLLVAPEQAEALANAIIQTLEQPEIRRRMGQAARRLVEQEFTWERVVERLTPILEAATCQIPISSRSSLLERMSV